MSTGAIQTITSVDSNTTGYYEYCFTSKKTEYKYIGNLKNGYYEGNGDLFIISGDNTIPYKHGIFKKDCLVSGEYHTANCTYEGTYEDTFGTYYASKHSILHGQKCKIHYKTGQKRIFTGRVDRNTPIYDEGETLLIKDQSKIDSYVPPKRIIIDIEDIKETENLEDTLEKGKYTYRCSEYIHSGQMQYYKANGQGVRNYPNGDYEIGLFLNDVLVKGSMRINNHIYVGTFDDNGNLDDGKVTIQTKDKDITNYMENTEIDQILADYIPLSQSISIDKILNYESSLDITASVIYFGTRNYLATLCPFLRVLYYIL